MKKAILTSLAAMVLSCSVHAEDSSRSKMIQEGIKVCAAKGFKTVGEKDKCVAEYSKKANSLYPARGSAEYAEKHYAKLSSAQAESTLQKLESEWKGAERGGYFSARRNPDQVTKKALVQEGWWIQTHILGAQQTQGDPWFIECKSGAKTAHIVRRCPLGKGGAE